MDEESDKLWFEGQKTQTIVFTEEDLRTTLLALDMQSGGFNTKDWNDFDKVKSRIMIQREK